MSAGQHRVEYQFDYAAPLHEVWSRFATHAAMAEALAGTIGNTLIKRVVASSDEGNPDGVGSVRRILPGPLGFDETIVRHDAEKCIEYRISRGSPLKNHLGRIEFKAVPGGTRLSYTISFDPAIPGTAGALKTVLRAMIGGGLKRLAREYGTL